MLCAPGLVFGGTEGDESHFHVLCVRTRFRRYRWRPIPISCFSFPDMFLAMRRASGPVSRGTEGVGSRFHVLISRTCFHIFMALASHVPFSSFERPDSFSSEPRASDHVFSFCALGHVFGGTEGVGSRFHVLRSLTRFRRFGGRRVPFSCFALRDTFSTVPRALGPVFIFCAPGFVFDDAEYFWSRFHVLRARTRFQRYQGRPIPFSCFAAPGHVFGGAEGVGSRLHVFLFRTRFWRYRGSRVPFSCFARPDSFSAEPRASATVFMFCGPGLVFGGTEGAGSCFHDLHARTYLRRYRMHRVLFSRFALPGTFFVFRRASGLDFMFRRYGGHQFPYSCFALQNSFSAVPRESGLVSIFCAPGLIFGSTEGVGFCFHVLRCQYRFRRCQVHQVPF
jgi:hypothetical protein